MMVLATIANRELVTGVVTVSGETADDTVEDPADAGISVIFQADGTVDVGGVQIDTLTDWIIPNEAATNDHEVFATRASPGGTLTGSSDALDTWLRFTQARLWRVEQTVVGQNTIDLDISVRFDGGATLSTGNYLLTAEVTEQQKKK